MKLRNYAKRFMASLLICSIMLFNTVGSNVYATGLEVSLLEALMYMLEAAAGSYGYAYSSQADLQTSAYGLQYIIENYDPAEDSINPIDRFCAQMNDYSDTLVAGTYALEAQSFAFLQDYVANVLSGNSSSTATPNVLDVEAYADISDFNAYLSSNYNVYSGVSSTGYVSASLDPDYYDNKNCCLIALNSDGTGFYIFSPVYADSVLLVDSSGNYRFYRPSTGKYIGVYDVFFTFINNSVSDIATSSSITSSGYVVGNSMTSSGYYNLITSYDWTYYPVISPSSRLFSSTSEIDVFNYIKSAYSLSGKLYGSSSAAKTYVADETTGTISIPLTGTYMATNVENAIATAQAENPSITQDELDAVVAQLIASNEELEGDIEESTSTLSALILEVKALAQANAVALADVSEQVSAISVVDGTAAEKLESIADQFEVIEGGQQSGSDDNNDDEPEIWVPVIPAVVKFLEPALEFLGDPLSEITKFLNKITDQIEQIPENMVSAFDESLGQIASAIEELPDFNAEAFREFFGEIQAGIEELPDANAEAFREFFGEIQTGFTELPQNIAEALPAIDISIPDALDYTNILNQISTQIENLFLIDTAVISDSLAGFDDIWAEKIPFMSNIGSLFDDLNFSDNYTYPVIKVQTPDILSSYYGDEYIILLDFADYSQYTLWCRNIVKAWIWFCFGLSVVNHFRTNISIG